MGHRANYVVIKKGTAKAYWDQWGAMGCVYSFADGPTSAIDAISDADTVNELMEWSYAEGGYLIDFDKKVAIVFGEPFADDFDESPGEEIDAGSEINAAFEKGDKEYLRLIAPRWKGWKLIFDDRGVDAFSVYLESRAITSIKCQAPSHPETTRPPVTVNA